MKQSHLLNSLINGQWMILPQYAYSQREIVEKLMDRSFASKDFDSILSERQPLMVLPHGQKKMAASSAQGGASPYDQCQNGTIVVFSLMGTMLKYGSYCSYGTMEIADAMKEASAHPNVSGCVLDIDSGGGASDAIAPMLEAIKCFQEAGKPVVACVDLCASASYYVASHCDEIIASNNLSAAVGSIGVMMSFRDYSKYYQANGIEDHLVYSSFSDWKNLPIMNALKGMPDEETRYDLIKSEELDPLAQKFMDAVRANRKNLDPEVEGVLSGRMFFAEKAKEVGLIDSVGSFEMAVKRCQSLGDKYLIDNYLKV